MAIAMCGTVGGLIPAFDSVTGACLGAEFLIALVLVESRRLIRRTGIPYLASSKGRDR